MTNSKLKDEKLDEICGGNIGPVIKIRKGVCPWCENIYTEASWNNHVNNSGLPIYTCEKRPSNAEFAKFKDHIIKK